MKLTLMIEGSASALATILAALPSDGSVSVAPAPFAGAAPEMPATVTHAPAPPMPANPAPFPPMPANPTGGDESDDDNAPVNVAAPATDKNGLPWDERIHAKSKATNADGSWRRRKGVADATVTAVEAELRNAGAAAAAGVPHAVTPPVAMPAPMPVPAMPAMVPPMPEMNNPAPLPAAYAPPMPDPAATTFPAPGAVPAFSPPPLAAAAPAIENAAAQMPPVAMPAPAPAPAPAAAPVGIDFGQFMQHLSGQMGKRDGNGAPLIHAEYLAAITTEIGTAFNVGLAAITDIANDPNKINYAIQLMQRDGRW